MKYNKIAEFIYSLAQYAKEDGDADSNKPSIKNPTKKRTDLASHLHKAAKHFKEGELEINLAWKICKKYMNKI